MNSEEQDKLIILDGIVENEVATHLQNVLLGDSFPWYYAPSSTHNAEAGDKPWLYHVFWYDGVRSNSTYADLIRSCFDPLFNLVGSSPAQVRTSMELRQVKGNTFWHVDREHEHFSIVYYVKDADGDTLFGDEQNPFRVSPKMGRCVLFSGGILHCNELPVKSDRCIINMIFDKPFPEHVIQEAMQ